jgi:hypothetical protein
VEIIYLSELIKKVRDKVDFILEKDKHDVILKNVINNPIKIDQLVDEYIKQQILEIDEQTTLCSISSTEKIDHEGGIICNSLDDVASMLRIYDS